MLPVTVAEVSGYSTEHRTLLTKTSWAFTGFVATTRRETDDEWKPRERRRKALGTTFLNIANGGRKEWWGCDRIGTGNFRNQEQQNQSRAGYYRRYWIRQFVMPVNSNY